MVRRRTTKRAAGRREYILPQSNLQDVGRELRKEYIANHARARAASKVGALLTARQKFWAFALKEALEGDPSSIARYVKSRRKLSQFDRNILANVLISFFKEYKPRQKRGRPQWARTCARWAIDFYQDWKDANRRNGINDWGHRDEMKDGACRVAIELFVTDDYSRDFPKENPPTFEQVRELMERSAARRR